MRENALRVGVFATAATFLLIVGAGVLLRPALPVDETRYLDVAWEMWLTGDPVLLTKNFALYTHKPPLLFWLINLVWSVTGVSEVPARLVGPLCAAAAIGMTATLARQLWPEERAVDLRAALALAGMSAFATFGGLTMFDALLTVTVLAGMLALTAALRGGQRRYWCALGVAIGAGVLAKGPVILVHLGPALALAPLWAGDVMTIRKSAWLRGAALALLVACLVSAIWLGPALWSGGAEYRTAILWTQTAGRIAQAFDHARPWWFFAASLPVLLFPWLYVPDLWRAARRAPWREPALLLCLVWAISAFVVFSAISGKQLHYLLPEMPALALIIARLSGRVPRLRLGLPAGLVIGAAIVGAAVAGGMIPVASSVAALPATCLLAAAGPLAALAVIVVRGGGLVGGSALGLATLMSLNLVIATTDLDAKFDTDRIGAVIRDRNEQGIAFFGDEYSAEFNFAARLTEPVAELHDAADLTHWAERHPGGAVIASAGQLAMPWKTLMTTEFRDRTYTILVAPQSPFPAQVADLQAELIEHPGTSRPETAVTWTAAEPERGRVPLYRTQRSPEAEGLAALVRPEETIQRP